MEGVSGEALPRRSATGSEAAKRVLISQEVQQLEFETDGKKKKEKKKPGDSDTMDDTPAPEDGKKKKEKKRSDSKRIAGHIKTREFFCHDVRNRCESGFARGVNCITLRFQTHPHRADVDDPPPFFPAHHLGSFAGDVKWRQQINIDHISGLLHGHNHRIL